jgi:putative transposase
LALRQQLVVLNQRYPRPQVSTSDKLIWVILRRLWPGWKHALILVRPETVVRWHRAGFKLYWKWLSRRRVRAGKKMRQQGIARADPSHSRGIFHLGRTAYPRRTENAWLRSFGTDRVALDAESAEPAKRLEAFLNNHRESMAAMDFLSVPTLTFGVLYCFSSSRLTGGVFFTGMCLAIRQVHGPFSSCARRSPTTRPPDTRSLIAAHNLTTK